MLSPRLSPQSGIALGPILFVLAILGIIGLVLSAGGSGFSTASVSDRVTADIVSQANLIRAKINECYLMYGTNTNYDGYPYSGNASIAVSTLNCSGDPSGLQNLWTGNRTLNLPPPTAGFGNWNYINTNPNPSTSTGGTAPGGRCIWIQPNASSGGIVQGLTHAAAKFNSSISNDGVHEVNYNPALPNQRFVVWITLPTGTAAADCTPQ